MHTAAPIAVFSVDGSKIPRESDLGVRCARGLVNACKSRRCDIYEH